MSLDPLPARNYVLAGAIALATVAAIYLYSAPGPREDYQRDDGRVGIQPWSRHYSEFVAAPGVYNDDDARKFEPPGTFDDVKSSQGSGGTPGIVFPGRTGDMGTIGEGREEQKSGGLPDYCR